MDLNQRSAYEYDLPAELIAQKPLAQRSASRLLVLQPGQTDRITHSHFTQLPDYVTNKDLLVFNDTRVVPARLQVQKDSGGRVDMLVESWQDSQRIQVRLRASRAPKIGQTLHLQGICWRVIDRNDQVFWLALVSDHIMANVLHDHGVMPLPPYIKKQPDAHDRQRYQTVYARHDGAIAAPTAGLHFDQAMLDCLAQQGIATTTVTLHVGAGTFLPLRSDDVNEHVMHSEACQVSADCVAAIAKTKRQGGRVIAVGTTVVRCLESAMAEQGLQPMMGDSQLFIRPGFNFRCVDGLLTNFHLPGSTLMMLVAAFAGYPTIMQAYEQAVAQRYRFFSYGDAMLICP